jgi:hypothetical protein
MSETLNKTAALHLAPLAGRGRIAAGDAGASSSAIRVRGSHHMTEITDRCPSPQPSPRKRGEREIS